MAVADAPEKKGIIQEFKEFALRGNVLDLAVAVVIGAAFNAIVQAFVADLIMPLVGAIVSTKGLEGLVVVIHGSEIKYGLFIESIVNFFLVALALFILIKTINQFRKKQQEEETAEKEADEAAQAAEDDAVKTEVALLAEIRDLLKEGKSA
ncbi:MAG: large conductance mechanosensitive channel protein MscL [Clostridiales Family XIII bacterium]|jgi:large conductance mechanosensitive channel|nr:large conductance mechanosensitive channel protein MscL [Clostridiales Family XIII bacterium]